MAVYSKPNNLKERLEGTQTEKNLHTALSGESQAHLRYKWFEARAREEGYIEISELFCTTAENEKEHAEIWFRCLGGWAETENNLDVAAAGENFEWSTMYSEFEETAKREGLDEIAALFGRVASIEKQHEENYRTTLAKLKYGELYHSSDENTKWICLNCGYVVTGKEPPQVCPTCAHPQGYFKKQEN